VSGAASGKTVEASHQLAYDVGRAIAKAGKTLTTGAAVGLPWYAAKGAFSYKSRDGASVGFSPASTYREHVSVYKLPVDVFDYINFTGMDYVGRDIHLVRSSEAVISVGGRMGSLHEFATALESDKIVGVLLGSGGLADFVPTLLHNIQAPDIDNVIYDTDPERLVKKVIKALDDKYSEFVDELDKYRIENHNRNHKVDITKS
jgi:uncharacterized protein (TIGR00725 family)